MGLYQFERKPHRAFLGGEFPFDNRYLLLRYLRRAGIAPDEALLRIVSPSAPPAR